MVKTIIRLFYFKQSDMQVCFIPISLRPVDLLWSLLCYISIPNLIKKIFFSALRFLVSLRSSILLSQMHVNAYRWPAFSDYVGVDVS